MKLLTLCFLGLILPFSFTNAQEKDKRKLEIFVEAFEKDKRVKNVTFELIKNGEEISKTESKNGRFSFIISEGGGVYSLFAKKKGYLTKEIIFQTRNFPFEKDYEYQDLYIEFIPIKNNQEANYIFKGQMIFEPESRAYKVEKIDSALINLEKNYKKLESRLDKVHQNAVENGDALAMLEEFEYAKNFYELALDAKPDDVYSRESAKKMDSLAALQKQQIEEEREQVMIALAASDDEQKPNKDRVKEDQGATHSEANDQPKTKKADKKPKIPQSEYYSVQLGAFHDWYDETAFSEVPDQIVAQGSDFKRVLSGRFNDRNKAIERMNTLKQNGFPDAFVVTMSGEERVGF